MKKFNLTFNKEIFEFAINDFIKNINFAINKIKAVEIVFNELFVFIIAMSEYNDIIFFNYKHIMSKFRSRDRSRNTNACVRNIGRIFLRSTLKVI